MAFVYEVRRDVFVRKLGARGTGLVLVLVRG